MTVIDFTTGLRERSIEQIPVAHESREYRCSINGKAVEVYAESTGLWRWRAGHYEQGRMAWWGRDFKASGQNFDTAAAAMQDAMERKAGGAAA